MRKKLIELLCKGHIKYLFYDQIADYLIANGVTVQEWISVKDRLPEKGKAVLCFCTNDDYWIALWDRCDDELWSDGEWWRAKDFVTHWMPLPQPPKGENNNE
jgi:hypothetical protein